MNKEINQKIYVVNLFDIESKYVSIYESVKMSKSEKFAKKIGFDLKLEIIDND